MKSSVNLATLAVLILCYVHGGVAGKHRGKYVKKKEPEPHKIFVMTTVLCSLESERPISQKYQAQRHILKSKFKE